MTAREQVWETTQQYLDGAPADEPAPDEITDEDQSPPDDDADYPSGAPVQDDDGWTGAEPRPVDLDGAADQNGASGSHLDSGGAADSEDSQQPPHSTPDLTAVSPTDRPIAQSDQDRYKKPLAVGAVIATGIATVLGSCAMLAMRTGPHVAADQTNANPTAVRVVAAPAATQTVDPDQDAPIPYRATAHGCLPGSTAGQSVAGDDHSQAWVCVLGANHGQYLVLDLGKTTHVSAVSITAGWPGKDASGVDQWRQHLMPTKVQWSCDDVPSTVVTQEDIHPGAAVKPFSDHGALCSKIVMIIQETGRTPADVPASSAASAAPGGPLDDILGPATTVPALPAPSGEKPSSDPADNSFAVAAIKILGHLPS